MDDVLTVPLWYPPGEATGRQLTVRLPCGWDEDWTAEYRDGGLWGWFTALLRRCTVTTRDDEGEPALEWLTAAEATFMAAALLVATDPQSRIRARCPAEGCRTDVEVDVDGDPDRTMAQTAFAAERSPVTHLVAGTEGDVEIRLARPADLAAIESMEPGSNARAALVRRCLIGSTSEPGPELVSAVEQAMQQVSRPPLDRLDSTCPVCRAPFTVPFNPVGELASALRRSAAALDHEVHLLALYYHWSHAEVMTMPTARRQRRVLWLLDELDGWAVDAASAGLEVTA